MHWEKLGRIYCPQGHHPKLVSHAANPVAVLIEGDLYRVFFSGRDVQSRSSIGFVDVDVVLKEVVREGIQPVFVHGPEGTFYAHGVSIGCCYEAQGQRFILFMGWQLLEDGRWRGRIGRLLLCDDLTVRLDGEGPFLSTDEVDPVSLSYPWVQRVSAEEYMMWYGSTLAWDAGNGEMLHVIRQAFSSDGHVWSRGGEGVPYRIGEAQAFSRPTVAGSAESGYQMWFSYRGGEGQAYRIGMAESPDARDWVLRLNDGGLMPSREGWDSDMVCYPFVFEHKDRRYMFYCGNGYGVTGFGMAAWVE